jgi:hypothetical protein
MTSLKLYFLQCVSNAVTLGVRPSAYIPMGDTIHPEHSHPESWWKGNRHHSPKSPQSLVSEWDTHRTWGQKHGWDISCRSSPTVSASPPISALFCLAKKWCSGINNNLFLIISCYVPKRESMYPLPPSSSWVSDFPSFCFLGFFGGTVV